MRFPEFEGEWEFKKGNEVFDNISNKNHNSHLPILAITQEHGAIPREFIDYKISVTDKSIEGYKVVDKGDFIISLRSFQGGIEYSEYDGICSPAYIILKPKIKIIDKFFKFYLKTPSYITSLNKNLEGIRDGKMISYKYFSEIVLPFPTIEEQKKIAIFLELIDERIQTQSKIVKGLESYFKGIKDNLFSQKIRFGDFTDDWEIKKLGEILVEPKQTAVKEPNKIELLTVKLHSKGIENTGNYPSVTKNGRPYFKRFKNEILVGRQNFHNGGIGIVKEENNGKICSNAISSYNVLKDNLLFVYYYISQVSYYSKVDDLIGGTGQKEISKIQFSKMKIKIPSLEEQIKISSFLSKIDQKIQTEKAILEQLEIQKKYLLQQMFV